MNKDAMELNLDDDTWDAVCRARLLYKRGINKSEWWHALRTYCGYNGSDYRRKAQIERKVDAWLAAHPSWSGRYVD